VVAMQQNAFPLGRREAQHLRMRRKNALVYAKPAASRGAVSRQYANWRAQSCLPLRCDIPDCEFHTKAMSWNTKPLKPILDHVNGCKWDNRPQNLRWVCPNCDSQLETRGGRNRGRVTNANAQGYQVRNSSGGIDANIFPTGIGLHAPAGVVAVGSQLSEDARQVSA
jgi:hypothetical protein